MPQGVVVHTFSLSSPAEAGGSLGTGGQPQFAVLVAPPEDLV